MLVILPVPDRKASFQSGERAKICRCCICRMIEPLVSLDKLQHYPFLTCGNRFQHDLQDNQPHVSHSLNMGHIEYHLPWIPPIAIFYQ